MSTGEIFLVLVRWFHFISASAWLGGGLFYILVLNPTLNNLGKHKEIIGAKFSIEFRTLVDTCMFVLLLSGAILTFNRLTPNVIGTDYGIVLAMKLLLAVWMFMLARGRRRKTYSTNNPRESDIMESGSMTRRFIQFLSSANMIVLLGIIVFLLSDILNALYEQSIQ